MSDYGYGSRSKWLTLGAALIFGAGFSLLLFAFHLSNPNSHAQTSGYSVVGNKVVGPNGKQWTPYGFVLECLGYKSNSATTCQPTKGAPGVDFSDLAKIKATAGFWHGNAVRLQVAQENLFDQAPYDAAFVNRMDSEVSTANSLGLVVVLTLQEEEWSGPVFPTQSAVTFWKWMANHYKNNPNVMFDLYNEPQLTTSTAGGEDNLWNIWQSGGTAPGNGQTYVGFQALVDAVRGQGANNVVIAESNLWDKDLTELLHADGTSWHELSGSNIAYGVEVNLYPDSRTPSQWNTSFGHYTQYVPIMPEAFRDDAGSTCDKNSPTDVPALLSYLNSIHMGAFVWTLSPGIATDQSSLTNPTTYPAPPATISCPSSLNGISDTNTVGPGQNLLTFFTDGTGTGGTPTPTITFLKPAGGATVSGSVSVSAKAAVSSGTITNVSITVDGGKLVSCVNPTCTSNWNTATVNNGTHTITATTTASDGKSNSATESVTVSNKPTCNLTAPSTISSPSQTTTSVSLVWKAGTDSCYQTSQLTYHIFRDGNHVGDSTVGSTAYNDGGLAPGTTYSYTVTASDPGGNTSAASAAFTQSTKQPNCPKPATPKGFSGTAPAATQVILAWQGVPNPSGTCIILHYLVSRNGVPLAQTATLGYTDTSVVAQTKYTYTVLAVETGNIAGTSASVTVTTPTPQQPDPGPTPPSGLSATAVSSNQVNLAWNASTDSVAGIKQYNVLRNGTQVGTTTTTSFGDSGLTANTTYSYQVVAVSGGNKTASSATVQATTLSNSTGGHSGGGTGTSTIPVLAGTTSVGSGSDTGASTSDNPAAGNAPSDSPSAKKGSSLSGSTSSTSHGLSAKQTAFIGTGIVSLLGAGYLGFQLWGGRRLKLSAHGSYPNDPDLFPHIVVHPTGPAGDTLPSPTRPGEPPTLPDSPEPHQPYREDH